ncbi:phage terminase small subunit [Lysobacter gummosus]|uniref:Phage terminase small subunit n=1 Tax=Lysobacter gummosus TaxID=262324 RepID=A0ABY3X689_9GAMM|nr:phage terminase small subunit [Lysobacter gummosus]UNP28083.1 phage terminase small subunit [Lysobacter gummosus]
MKLAEDRRRLKLVQSVERKIEVKRKLLPEYAPWIEGVLSSGRGGQDAVLMFVLVWHIDAGNYADALRIADYALRFDLAMPDTYQRTTATVIAEQIADAALIAQAGGAAFSLGVLSQAEELTRDKDMPDEVRAKLHKALGIGYMAKAGEAPYSGAPRGWAEIARDHLRRALQLHDRVGVKKEIERLDRALNKPDPALRQAESGGPESAPA